MLWFHTGNAFLKDDTKKNIPSELAAFTTYKIIDMKCPILKKRKHAYLVVMMNIYHSLVCNIFFVKFGFNSYCSYNFIFSCGLIFSYLEDFHLTPKRMPKLMQF